MDSNLLALFDSLIEKAEATVDDLKSARDLAVSRPEQEVGYAKEGLWFVYWLWTSDAYKNLEAYVKEAL